MRGNFLFLYFLYIINGDNGYSLRLVFSFQVSMSEKTKSTDFCKMFENIFLRYYTISHERFLQSHLTEKSTSYKLFQYVPICICIISVENQVEKEKSVFPADELSSLSNVRLGSILMMFSVQVLVYVCCIHVKYVCTFYNMQFMYVVCS